MIPIHDFQSSSNANIRIIKLGTISKYDISTHHRHNYIELFIFEKGGGIHSVDFQELPINDHCIHVVTAGRVHRMQRAFDSNGYVILFKADIFKSDSIAAQFIFELMCYDVSEIPPVFMLEQHEKSFISNLMQEIWRENNQENPLKNEIILGHLNIILLLCLRTMPKQEHNPSAEQQIYRKFRQLLQKQFRSLKKVKDYSAILNISDKQLNETVKKHTGQSVSSIIYGQIILEAKRLLQTQISTKETAYALNFEDPSHFSKFFKSQTGLSPSQFAKVHA
ncbi:AraC family transcriptional regulator [Crocinitomix catalasitica]|uniref:AraC family transcriptional regulator n=1 Tax=Crocinitomix catalasitica TaxID=184607 RepID=UPI000684F72B|nr:helix-turn-helix domain-containing protein [Crocinitomix catalasitica]